MLDPGLKGNRGGRLELETERGIKHKALGREY